MNNLNPGEKDILWRNFVLMWCNDACINTLSGKGRMYGALRL